MPNWCMNSATFKGSKEKLQEIVKACENGKLLEFLVPIGEWDYGKAVEEWGTKWDAIEINWSLDEENNELHISFDTAWAPPIAAYSTAEQTHNLEIQASCYEPGMLFIGEYFDEDYEEYSVDFEDEDWRNTIPQNLIDDWGLEDEYDSWKEW